MLKTIKLYGDLREITGHSELDAHVNSVGDSIRFLLMNWPQLEAHMNTQHYQVLTDGTDIGEEAIHYPGSDSNTEAPHGLGVAPGLIIIKKLNASGNDWRVYSQGTFTTTASISLFLNETDASTSESERVTVVTSTTFSVATGGSINGSGVGLNGA